MSTALRATMRISSKSSEDKPVSFDRAKPVSLCAINAYVGEITGNISVYFNPNAEGSRSVCICMTPSELADAIREALTDASGLNRRIIGRALQEVLDGFKVE